MTAGRGLVLALALALAGCGGGPERASSYCDAVEDMRTEFLNMGVAKDGEDLPDLEGAHGEYVDAAGHARDLAPEELQGHWDTAFAAIEGSLTRDDEPPPQIEGRAEAFKALNEDATTRCGFPVLGPNEATTR